MVVIFGIAGSAGLALLTFQVKRIYGWPGALATALVLGTGFWVVIQTRKTVDAALIPMFVSVLLVLCLLWFAERRRWALAAMGSLLGLMVAIHVATFAQIPAVMTVVGVALLADFRMRRTGGPKESFLFAPAPTLVAIGGFFLMWSPVWLRELLRGSNGIERLLGQAGDVSSINLEALRITSALIFDGGAEGWFGAATAQAHAEFVSTWFLPGIVYLLATLLFVALLTRGSGSMQRGAVVAITFVVLPIVVLVYGSFEVALHYVTQIIPAAALAIGAAVGWGFRLRGDSNGFQRWRRLAAGTLLGAVALAAVIQTILIHQALDFVTRVDTRDGFDVPLRYQLETANRAAALARGEQVGYVAGSEDMQTVIWALERGRFEALQTQTPETLIQRRGGEPDVIWLHPSATLAIEWIEANRDFRSECVQWPGGRCARLALRVGDRRPISALRNLAQLDNGVVIDAILAPVVENERIVLPVVWRIDRITSPPADQMFFVHLVDGEGRIVAQGDGIGWPVGDWEAGDEAITWFSIDRLKDLPPGRYGFRLGMHTPGVSREQVVSDSIPIQDGNMLVLDGAPWGLTIR